jgi:hypothetical protein
MSVTAALKNEERFGPDEAARRPGRFLYIHNTGEDPPGFIGKIDLHRVDILFQYDLPDADLGCYDALILPTHCDQRHLAEITPLLDAYLDAGGTIMINGHVEVPFLRELKPFEPLPVRNRVSLTINRERDHALFEEIDGETLTLRKGVAGFYGRGGNPAPEGAEIINSVGTERLPVDWIYHRPGGGRIFSHSGNDFCGFFTSGDADSRNIIQHLHDWLAETSQLDAAAVLPRFRQPDTAARKDINPIGRRIPIAAIDGGLYYHIRSLEMEPYGHYFDEVIYIRDVAGRDLSNIDTLVIPCRLNARLLSPLKVKLQDYMRGGGRLVVMGETFPDRWLDEVNFIPRPTNYWWWLKQGADLGVRMATGDHPINDYLDARAATWHLHGVFEPRKPEQRSLIETREGECLLFEDRESFAPGTLIATTLDPFYHHGSCFMPATTEFLKGFLRWLADTSTTTNRSLPS